METEKFTHGKGEYEYCVQAAKKKDTPIMHIRV